MSLKTIVKKFNELLLKRYCNEILYKYITINKKQECKLINNNYHKQFKKKSICSNRLLLY